MFFVFSSKLFAQDTSLVNELARLRARVDSLATQVIGLRSGNTELEDALHGLLYMPQEISICGERVPLEDIHVAQKLRETLASLVVSRSGRQRVLGYFRDLAHYGPFLDSALQRESMCTDLKYLPIVESEFNLRAHSSASAVGMWQIIPSTARRLGLRINGVVDERRDPTLSTRAALRHLKESYVRYGHWLLAIPAYNTGDPNVIRSLRMNRDSSFFNMIFLKANGVLNNETMDYNYLFIAQILIQRFSARYYFSSEVFSPWDTEVRSYSVRCAGRNRRAPCSKNLNEIASEFGTSGRALLWLNPHIKGFVLPEGDYNLAIPRRH